MKNIKHKKRILNYLHSKSTKLALYIEICVYIQYQIAIINAHTHAYKLKYPAVKLPSIQTTMEQI